jgi:hypothetical protein
MFVLAFALAFRRVVGDKVWQVVLQCFPAVLCILLAAYPVVDKFPQPFVGPDRILGRSVVPKEVLDIELAVLGKWRSDCRTKRFMRSSSVGRLLISDRISSHLYRNYWMSPF